MDPLVLYLFLLLFSFVTHFTLIIPFINFLYRNKLQRAQQHTKDPFNNPTPIFDSLHKHKAGVPVGGGILVILATSFLYLLVIGLMVYFGYSLKSIYVSSLVEAAIILFTFSSFGILGYYDDIKTIFPSEKFFGLRLRQKLFLEVVIAAIIAGVLYFYLNITFINLPFFGPLELGYWYMFFATFFIVAFTNAVNITDGLDGLAGGILLISLLIFWLLARTSIDVPISVFLAIWIGGLIAFLYFNIYPARVFMGDAGALAFGATFAVISLLLGKSIASTVIGGIFVLEIGSSALQLFWKKFFGKKLFTVAPLHLNLQKRGWEEPKVVFRLWLASILCGIIGLMMAFL